MRYTDKKICEATTAELLHAIVHAEGLADGPRKIAFAQPVKESLVSINSDQTARILIFDEDIAALNKAVGSAS